MQKLTELLDLADVYFGDPDLDEDEDEDYQIDPWEDHARELELAHACFNVERG